MPLKIHQLVVTPLQSNCYLVHEENSQNCIIIDPGGDAEFIKQKILDEELTPTHILATHGHFDHIGAVLDLQLSFNIPFLIHKSDEFLVKRLRESSIHFTSIDPGPPPIITQYLNKNRIQILNFDFEILNCPGHTPGSVCFYYKPPVSSRTRSGIHTNGILFVGDLIFENGGAGRTDFAYSDPHKLDESIHRISKLPQNTMVYSGHGKPFQISDFSQPPHDDRGSEAHKSQPLPLR